MSDLPNIGFVGLGIMGGPMALNLLNAGYSLNINDKSRSRIDVLAASGAVVCDSPMQVASSSDVVFIMVRDSEDANQVVLGQSGIIHEIRPGSTVIVTSTISPDSVRNIADRLAQVNVDTLDAPVSGGEEGAKKATLSIMVGGKPEVFAACLPILESVGRNIVHLGPVGAGTIGKLSNQVIASVNMLAMCEGLTFAAKAGADLPRLLSVLQAGTAQSWALDNQAIKVLERDFAPGFMVSLQQKDLRIALAAAEELHVALPGCSLVHELYKSVESEPGGGGLANHAFVRALEKLSDVVVRADA